MLLATSLAFFFVVFLGASIAVAVFYLAFLKMRAEETEAAETELITEKLDAEQREPIPGEIGLGTDSGSALLRDQRLSTITFWDAILARFDFVALVQTQLQQAELSWSVGRISSMMLLIGIVILAVLLRFLPLLPALIGATAVALSPYFYILHKRTARFQKFRENFPDVLDSLARALRAGYPLSAAMNICAAEAAAPVAGELRHTAAEANLGRGWPHALENLGRRVPLLEVNTFIAAVQLHARTGGRLSEVMAGLAEQMREGLALQGEVRSLAAHGKMTGLILTILPVGIAVMMMIVSPGYMNVLFNHPLGKTLIAAAIGGLVLAHFVIRRIVDIEI